MPLQRWPPHHEVLSSGRRLVDRLWVVQLLPARPRPRTAEAFDSWIERIAVHNGAPVNVILNHAGLTGWSTNGGAFIYQVRHPRGPTRRLGAMTGLDLERLDNLMLTEFERIAFDLSSYDASRPQTLRPITVASWCSWSRSRCCPQCLVEDDYSWQRSWRWALHAVCVRHGRLLLDSCPGCGLPCRTTYGPVPHGRGIPRRDRCMNLVNRPDKPRGHRCDWPIADWGSGSTMPALQIDAQREVLDHLVSQTAVMFGETVSRLEWHAALRMTMGLVRRSFADSEFGEVATVSLDAIRLEALRSTAGDGRQAAEWSRPPRSAAHTAGVLPASLEILNSPSRAAISDLALRSMDLDRRASRNCFVPESPDQPHWWRTIWAAHRTKRNQTNRYWWPGIHGLDPAALPGSLSGSALAEFGDLLDGAMPVKRGVFAAVCVARALGARSWLAAWRLLGYPDSVRNRSWLELPLRQVREAGREEELAEVSFRLAATAQDWCRVDFGHRRQILSHLHDVDAGWWHRTLREAGIRNSRYRASTKYVAMWVWIRWTRGDLRFTPGFLAAESDGATRASLVEGYRQFEFRRASLLEAVLGHDLSDATVASITARQ